MKFICIFIVVAICIFALEAKSQNLEGRWNGFFITIFGKDIPYRDTFQFSVEIFNDSGKIVCTTFTMKGDFIAVEEAKIKFNSSKQRIIITETKVVAISEKSATTNPCLMKFDLLYRKSGDREEMAGKFTSKTFKDAIDCGDGEMYIRKAQEEIKAD